MGDEKGQLKGRRKEEMIEKQIKKSITVICIHIYLAYHCFLIIYDNISQIDIVVDLDVELVSKTSNFGLSL